MIIYVINVGTNKLVRSGKKHKLNTYEVRHNNLVDILYDTLKEKPYVDFLIKNHFYYKGEFDVLSIQNGRLCYYEVKGRHTLAGSLKAINQTMRGTDYLHTEFGNNSYGIYVTPNNVKLISKNGLKR